MKVGIYCRVSKDKHGADRSKPLQEADGIEFAKTNHYTYEMYSEKEGTSGTLTVDDRPELYRLLNDVKAGKIQAIYAYDISRLERNDNDRFLIFHTLNEANAKLYTKVDGFVDFKRPEIKLQLDILSATNSYMVSLTKAKVKDTLNKNIREGRKHSAPAYGFMGGENKKLIVNPETAKVVKKMYDLSVKGNGGTAIAKALSSEGIPTPTSHVGGDMLRYGTKNLKDAVIVEKGKLKWNAASVLRIIKNPIYKGERMWNDVAYPVEPIVSAAVWENAQQAIKKNKNNSVNNTKHFYLLAGKVFCGCCGNTYHGYTSVPRDVHVYKCYNSRIVNNVRTEKCTNKRIDQFTLEDIIWNEILKSPLLIRVLLAEFDPASKSSNTNYGADIKKITAEINSIKSGKRKLIDLVAKDIISEQDLADQVPEMNKEIAELEAVLKDVESKQELSENNVAVFNEVRDFQKILDSHQNPTFNIKRRIVEIFIDKVHVNFDIRTRLTDLEITFKLNQGYHSIGTELSLDLRKNRKALSSHIDGGRCTHCV